MDIKFRKLRAEDVEVRPTDTAKKGTFTLLLYIDSRSAADILNEAVGEFNWTIEYKALGDKIYGRLSIWDEEKQRWVFKEDTGSESNIEAGKGLSSDILKRCLVRWGCDALYSAPRIKITDAPSKWYIGDKLTMKFEVSKIVIDDRNKISELEIVDRFGNFVYGWKNGKDTQPRDVRYTEASSSKKESESPREDYEDLLDDLADFYYEAKEKGAKKSYIRSFYDFYKEKIERDGFVPKSLDTLWDKWQKSPLRKEDDKREAAASRLSDNE